MKKVMYSLLVVFFLLFSFTSFAEDKKEERKKPFEQSEKFTQQECKLFLEAAMSEQRFIFDLPTEDVYTMLNLSECSEDKSVCIVKEVITTCGLITQSIDYTQDDIADATATWFPVIVKTDTKQHVVFVIGEFKEVEHLEVKK